MRKNGRIFYATGILVLLVAGLLITGCPTFTWVRPHPLTEADAIGKWSMEFNWCCDSTGPGVGEFILNEGGTVTKLWNDVDSCVAKTYSMTEYRGMDGLSADVPVEYDSFQKATTWDIYTRQDGTRVLELDFDGVIYTCTNPMSGGHLKGTMVDTLNLQWDGCWEMWKLLD